MNDSPDKVIILGGKGMLGADVAAEFKNRNINYEIFDLPEFDITNERQLLSVIHKAKTIVNCAAYTDVEKAESERDLAYRVNAEAVGQLGTFAKKAGAYVIHISTDFVFDGTSDRTYVETDPPNPINSYGASKLAGERLLLESSCENCIIRVEWTYGLNGNNFVKKLIALAKKNGQLKVVDDQIGSPTATTEIAKVICELLDKRSEGLFHFANAGYASRFDMAKFVFEKLNMPVALANCKSGDFPSAAKRPLNSCFNCGKIEALLGRPIDPWQKPLEKFLKQL
jgi:dTDP-4-dehydrorhamnose reductase